MARAGASQTKAHAFANEKSAAYDATAAKQAWDRMMAFLGRHL